MTKQMPIFSSLLHDIRQVPAATILVTITQPAYAPITATEPTIVTATAVSGATTASSGSGGLKGWKLALAILVPLVIVVLIIIMVLWSMCRRRGMVVGGTGGKVHHAMATAHVPWSENGEYIHVHRGSQSSFLGDDRRNTTLTFVVLLANAKATPSLWIPTAHVRHQR